MAWFRSAALRSSPLPPKSSGARKKPRLVMRRSFGRPLIKVRRPARTWRRKLTKTGSDRRGATITSRAAIWSIAMATSNGAHRFPCVPETLAWSIQPSTPRVEELIVGRPPTPASRMQPRLFDEIYQPNPKKLVRVLPVSAHLSGYTRFNLIEWSAIPFPPCHIQPASGRSGASKNAP